MHPQNLINARLLPLLRRFRGGRTNRLFELLNDSFELIPSHTRLNIRPDDLIEVQLTLNRLLLIMTLIHQFMHKLHKRLLLDFGVGVEAEESHEWAGRCSVDQEGQDDVPGHIEEDDVA